MKNSSLLALMLFTILHSCLAYAESKRFNVHLNFDTDVLIRANKTVSIRAQCIENEGDSGLSVLNMYAATTQATGTTASNDYNGNQGNWLFPSTPPIKAWLLFTEVSMGGVIWENNIDQGFVIDTIKLRGLAFDSETAILGINSDGCYLSVAIEKINKFRTSKR